MKRVLLSCLVLMSVLSACHSSEAANTIQTQAPGTTEKSRPPSTTTTTTSAVAEYRALPPPAPTTTLPVICRADPFTDGFAASLAGDYRGISITAHVYDARTGCEYSLNPQNRQLTASVFKVMIMAGTLLEAQRANRPVSEREMDLLIPMITESANSPVRALWRSFGGSPWFSRQGEIFELSETLIRGDDYSSWGGTRTSARDQVYLLRQVLLGEWGELNDEYREVALGLMTSIVDSQSWGVTAGVPTDWVVAQKNGFAGSIINSVGWVDEPGPSQGYVVAILTRGWSNHPAGIAATERISEAIAGVMTPPPIEGLPTE